VPPKPDTPPHGAFASAAPGQSRLSIGHSQAGRSAASKAVAPQVVALEAKLREARAGQKGGGMKWVMVGAVVIICGVGGYFGYTYFSEWQAKRKEAAQQAAKAAAQQAASAAAEAALAAPTTPAPEKELPVIAPAWTLEVDKATIPTSKVNGLISGTNFLAENAMCTDQVLRLSQGTPASPDREILVYLRLNRGESPTNHTWTVTQETKGRSVPQVVKRWKTNPRYAPQMKSYSSGYAMKLELGVVTNGVLPGQIFVALPDAEQSVVAGVFKATTTLGGASGAATVTPVAPDPVAAPLAPRGAERSAFDKRYGVRK
jgi:type II secretory pathway pseudopilin PulG